MSSPTCVIYAFPHAGAGAGVYRPWQNKAVVVQNKNLDCRPCGKHGHASCPIKTHECMKSIAPSQVLEASES